MDVAGGQLHSEHVECAYKVVYAVLVEHDKALKARVDLAGAVLAVHHKLAVLLLHKQDVEHLHLGTQ